MKPAFWIDYGYDQEQASDGESRFGVYARRSAAIAECWDGTWDGAQARQARFAVAAWDTATPPTMAPGFVRRHLRIIHAEVLFNKALFGAVELVAPWPEPLARSQDWQDGSWWRDWPTESSAGREVYREPDEDEIAAGYGYMLPSVRLVFPLRASLPSAPGGPRDGVEAAATEAAEALVSAMNGVVDPVLRTLERS